MAVSIPFIAGQWSLHAAPPPGAPQRLVFQSPSLRGSGRFRRGRKRRRGSALRFNPLHCGAVVASSDVTLSSFFRSLVSIPFIAGQWSLPGTSPNLALTPRSFNPLHCGAVVASGRAHARQRVAPGAFQSPSLRGSGRFPVLTCKGLEMNPAFQSPSLRGSGRFARQEAQARTEAEEFQSPSLRGSGRFTGARSRSHPHLRVSIPFIAGQWSLRTRAACGGRSGEGFNPLHCGAVVASNALPALPPERRQRFNPLHCGAVVASSQLGALRRAAPGVSIPFIAGQWSLRDFPPCCPPAVRRAVSIPFIAGQWSLLWRGPRSGRRRKWSFNPLHCGAVVAS